MAEYQELAFGIQVPTTWPVQQLRNKILEIVRKAIMFHLDHSDKQVILTMNNIPTELKQNESGIGYDFDLIEEIPRDSYKIDLILPAEIMMISDVERASIPIETENLAFHSLDLGQEMQAHREVTIAVPDIFGILEMNGITGDQIHKVIFKTKYLNINIMEISTILRQLTSNAHPIFVRKVAEDALNVICFNQIPAPRWWILEQLGSLLGICVIGTLFLLFTYSLIARVDHTL